MYNKKYLFILIFTSLISLSFSEEIKELSDNEIVSSRKFGAPITEVEVTQDESKIYLDSGGSVWVTQSFFKLEPELKISASKEALIKSGKLESGINFNIKTNYSYFITKYELIIYDGKGTSLSQPLKVIQGDNLLGNSSITWDGSSELKNNFRNGDQILYKLKVYDKNGNYDTTTTGIIDLVSFKKTTNYQNFKENFEDDDDKLGNAQLLVHNIPVNSSMIKISGTNFKDLDNVTIKGVDYDVKDNQIFVLEYLPSGKYEIPVKLKFKDNREEDHILKVEVPEKYSIHTGLADVLIGSNYISGNQEVLGNEDPYKDGDIYNEAQLAFYSKNKFSDKFYLTAQLNTRETDIDSLFSKLNHRDNMSIFDRVENDNEIYYPTYGDESFIFRDVNTQSKFYLKAEYSKSELLWGNYNTGFTGTKYMQYNRSLYGGKAIYRTDQTTKFGDDRFSINSFISEANSLYSHEEFLATGGSLYFLKNGDIITGSEKISVKIVDKSTNLTKSIISLQEGRDYEFDNFQGRIILNRPLNAIANLADSDIIQNSPSGGTYVYLVADYEYLPLGDSYLEDPVWGIRNSFWVNDHIGLGYTFLKDSKENTDYELKGGLITLKATEDSYFLAEASETNGTQGGGNYLSYDGGISFNKIKENPFNQKGEAYNILGVLNLSDLNSNVFSSYGNQLSGWYQQKDREYSYSASDSNKNIETYGTELILKPTDKLKLKFGYNNQTEKNELDQETAKLEEVKAQGEYSINDKWTTGAAIKQVTELRKGKIGDATLGGLRAQYDANEDTQVYVEGQADITRDNNYDANNLFTIGGETKINEKLRLNGKTSQGSRGQYTEIGANYSFTNDHDIYLNYSLDDDQNNLDKISVGQRVKLTDKVNIFQENQFANDNNGKGKIGSYGVDYEYKEDYKIGASFQHGNIDLPDDKGQSKRTGVSVFSKVDDNQLVMKNKIEYRQDESEKDIKQFLTTNNLKYVINNEYTIAGKGNYSNTKKDSEKDANFAEASIGLAYRPIYYDRMNFLSRYTYILENDNNASSYYNSNSESSRNREYKKIEAHVFEFENIYSYTQRLDFGLKFAYRYENEDFLRADDSTFNIKNNIYLVGLKSSYKIMKDWEIYGQYHWLFDRYSDDVASGAIVGLSKYINKNLKIGGGYNFSGFSDDLRRDDYKVNGWFFNISGIL